MPRGGRRYGAGRPGWKAKAERSLSLDGRVMRRQGVLRDRHTGSWRWTDSYTGEDIGSIGYRVEHGALVLNYMAKGGAREQRVPITRTRCHFGGSRPWFVCPCGRRAVALYLSAGRFACRHCQKIAYRSQSEDHMGRICRRERKVKAKLGLYQERPKGMHDTTYESLLSALCECERRKDAAMGRAVERLGV